MKINKITMLMLGSAMLAASCSDIDEQLPEGGTLLKEQSQETNDLIPERARATFNGMFTMMAKPYGVFTSSSRADDFGFVMMALSNDFEGADMSNPNNDYNWFSTCGELSSRNANYANPYIRYVMPYRQIGIANEVISGIDPATTNPELVNMMAQARAMRAFDYMSLAPYFVFNYETSKDEPCVPLLKDGVDYTNNPRALTSEIWASVIEDLNYAVDHLDGFDRGTNKAQIDKNVALGLRARAYLYMGEWAQAAADAKAAREGYTPASMAEVSKPAFCEMSEHNWMWAINIPTDLVISAGYSTSNSWLSAFTWDGYGPATENVPYINVLLWNQIPASDVRKGWWLDENLHSPNLAGLEWANTGVKGDDIATWADADGNKLPYAPYTNVKFGMKSGIGSTTNDNDWCLMRVEEMYLIEAEATLKAGNEGAAKQLLENFVKTYRNPSYAVSTGRTLADEIWLQRRIELWGEGFFTLDMKRLGKPLVRIHPEVESNLSDAFQFNVPADNGWLNLRFPQTEMDNNAGVVDNAGGELPVAGQYKDLRDGVTD